MYFITDVLCMYIQLYKAELERDQLQQLMEMSKQHQREEVESVQKSHRYMYMSLHGT